MLSWGGWFTFCATLAYVLFSIMLSTIFLASEKGIFFCVLEHYFCFFLINSTNSWKARAFHVTVSAFYVFAFIFHTVWIMFITFATYLVSSVNLFALSKFLTFEALQGSWYIMFYPFYHEFKSWTRRIAFHIALIPLGKVWIQLFSLQLWVNSRTD